MASDPLLAFLLLGLGYTTLSVSPPALPLVKWTVRQVSAARARAAAAAALDARNAEDALTVLRAALAEMIDITLLDPEARLPTGQRPASLKA
jgi:phosphotransferase system enzyme I (PtsI)